MLRDTIKDTNYFTDYIANNLKSVNKLQYALDNDEVVFNQIPTVKNGIWKYKISSFIAKYSIGDDVRAIRPDFLEIIYMAPTYDLYHSYTTYIDLLSIAYLYEVSDEDYKILSNLAMKFDNTDYFTYYLIHMRDPNFIFPDDRLNNPQDQEIISIIDGTESKEIKVQKLKQFLDKKWYQSKSDFAWYDSHKNTFNTYSGYWSFLFGAIFKYLSLDDSGMEYQQHYTYDLVNLEKKVYCLY